MRKIKVNNCGDCPLCYLDDAWFMCNELDIDMGYFDIRITKGFPEIPKNCPLKKESLKIELECEK